MVYFKEAFDLLEKKLEEDYQRTQKDFFETAMICPYKWKSLLPKKVNRKEMYNFYPSLKSEKRKLSELYVYNFLFKLER